MNYKLNKIKTLLIFLALSISFSSCAQTNELERQSQTPKNVILIIGDGMGFAQVEAAIISASGKSNFTRFPISGMITTKSANNEVTDSGAGGTALATGKKTNNGMIGVTPDSALVRNMLEIFSSIGKSTGVVTTCSLTHATPASFLAHNASRNNTEAIASDIVNSPVDVFIGGGMNKFTEREDGRNLIREMQQDGWNVLTCLAEAEGKLPKLAVFTSDEEPVAANKGREDELQRSVKVAIDALSYDPDGFFLMIEGSQIDWACHNNDSAYLVAEMKDFDRTLGDVLAFAEKNHNTLIVVTADHECGGLTLQRNPNNSDQKPRFQFTTTNHTAVMVPVFAFGQGANYFSGMYDNTDIFKKILFSTNIAR